MKKIIAVFSLISILFCFSSCKNNPFDKRPDYLKERDIVLDDRVDSVEFTSENGEKTTFFATDDFYTVLDKIDLDYTDDKKLVVDAKIQLDDETPLYINFEQYCPEDSYLQKYEIHKEGELSTAVIDLYSEDTIGGKSFKKYVYKDEIAFSGFEGRGTDDKTNYFSSKFPKAPEGGTELYEMYSAANDFNKFLGMASLFRYYNAPATEGIDINSLISVEFKLYENYIVLKQTAPFITVQSPNFSTDEYIFYKQAEASDCSIIQEVYCNVETGKIELIRFYGDTTMHTYENWGRKWEVDIKVYVYDINESELNKKVDKLADYVKSNAD